MTAPQAWNNGQADNTGTNTAAECKNLPYATHDWITDHALDILSCRTGHQQSESHERRGD